MRIVQVSPYDLSRHGGVQQHILSLTEELRRCGHEVLVIEPGPPGPKSDTRLRIGKKKRVSLIGTSFELSLASKSELRALDERLAAWRPDVVHYHTIWVPFLPWQIFRRTRAASVATFHDTPPPGLAGAVLRAAFKLMSRLILSRLDGAITVSAAPLSHLRPGRLGVKPIVLPPATDLSEFLAIAKNSATGGRAVLFVGRLEPRKGINTLLEAWDLIASGRTPLPRDIDMPRLIVAGSGELEGMVTAASQRLGKDLLRHVPAPDRTCLLQLLSSAAVAVSPALYGESFGIVLVEALASGTPIVAASNRGYASVMTGQGLKLLVPPGDALALAKKILDLLADEDCRRELGRWGREHARQFDISEVSPQIEGVYRAAIMNYDRSNPQGAGSQL